MKKNLSEESAGAENGIRPDMRYRGPLSYRHLRALGWLCLIVAFSFVFQLMDPGINSYIDALWYCFAVVTTIGFGDVMVTSLLGKALSVVLGIYGIVVVALITSIIVNFYNEIKDEKSESQPVPENPDPEQQQNEPPEPPEEK